MTVDVVKQNLYNLHDCSMDYNKIFLTTNELTRENRKRSARCRARCLTARGQQQQAGTRGGNEGGVHTPRSGRHKTPSCRRGRACVLVLFRRLVAMVTAHSSSRGQRDTDKRHLVVLVTHEKMEI